MSRLDYVLVCWLFLGILALVLKLHAFAQYKSDQIAQSQAKEKQYQEATDEIRKAKDAQIANINNQLADALISLRNRPSRTEQASNGQGCNGSALFAEDAEFLIRKLQEPTK
jgi:hypothetical protein